MRGLAAFTGQRIAGWLLVGLTAFQVPAADSPQSILLDGTRPGRVFEGIGACSAGASSRLLIEYPEPQRRQILDGLFTPNVGAAFHHLKVEIGGDVNSTDGVEPSHQHTREDLDFSRGYEWWLMKEARRRNPALLLDALQWGAPGWIGDGQFFSQDNADYIVRFLQGARRAHGLELQFVGIWNETPYEPDWIKLLRQTLDRAGFNGTRIVAADQVNHWGIVEQIRADPELDAAVGIVGVHYPDSRSPGIAQECGKPIWSSEDGPWRGDWVGAAKLARTYNRNYLVGRMTKTIIWSPITSYYDALPLPGSGVMRANEPWSGHFEIQPAVWATAHTTQFAQPGWHYLDGPACGWFAHGGTYVTLRAPNHQDYSIIAETLDAVGPQVVTFRVEGGLSPAAVQVWRTSQDRTFVQVASLKPDLGGFTVTLDPGCIYSLTTTRGQRKGDPRPPASRPFPLPYRESFEGYTPGATPRHTSDQAGVFEVHPRPNGQGSALKQVMTRKGIEWHYHLDPFPETILGDRRWRDYAVGIDALLPEEGFVAVFGRLAQVPQSSQPPDGYGFRLWQDGTWSVMASTNFLASGRLAAPPRRWCRIVLAFEGERIHARIDDRSVVTLTNRLFAAGMAGLGSGWDETWLDNLDISPVPGAAAKAPPADNRRVRLKSITASSRWDFSYPAEAAIDADPSATRWAAARGQGAGEWLELDLGGLQSVESVQFREFGTNIRAYRIQAWDNQGWREVVRRGPPSAPVESVAFPPLRTHRLRLVIDEALDTPSLWDIGVRLATDSTPPSSERP